MRRRHGLGCRDDDLRIAFLSPLLEAVPAVAYGGTERIVGNLADAPS